MNREIKFRGLVLFGEWVYGDMVRLVLGGNIHYFIQPLDSKKVTVIYDSISQFTGLQDKNGTDIYEGDIIRILYTDWISKSSNDGRTLEQYLIDISCIGEVQFKDCEFGVKICSDILDPIHCGKYGFIEVIGNIHENPELLKS